MAERGDAYMTIVNPAQKIPTQISRELPWKARRVSAITAPRKPTSNTAATFMDLI